VTKWKATRAGGSLCKIPLFDCQFSGSLSHPILKLGFEVPFVRRMLYVIRFIVEMFHQKIPSVSGRGDSKQCVFVTVNL
jgi:hypothetical protein